MIRAALSFPLEHVARSLLAREPGVDFTRPAGEAALVPPDSVSWQIFRNPVSMYVGGVAAVLMELGEPRVRAGVWEHSDFRNDPARRLRRTGLAAMITVYGAQSQIEATAARVRAMHARIAGSTPGGVSYRADDPELLRWVQATAAYAFLAAYRRHVRPVSRANGDRYFAEGREGAALYGVRDAPGSEAAFAGLLAAMLPRLEPSPILHELLAILRTAPILPRPLRWFQRIIGKAAVDLLPGEVVDRLELRREGSVSHAERALLRAAAAAADRAAIPSSPSAQACLRLGLPTDYLLRRATRLR